MVTGVNEQSHLNSLINAAGLAVVVLDLDLRIVDWNEAAERLYGWSLIEVRGEHISIVWPGEELTHDVGDASYLTVIAGEAAEYRTWRLRKDGSRFFAEVHTSPLTDSSGEQTGTVGLVRNAGQELHLAERAVEAERRFSSAFDGAALPMLICELDGTIVERNEAYGVLTRRAALVDDIRLLDLIEPAYRPQVGAALATLASDPGRFEGIEVPMIGSIDHILNISVSPVDNGLDQPPLALVQLIDVSDQLRVQAELAEIATLDPLTGTFNRSCLDPLLRSLTIDTIVGLLFLDLDSFKAVNDTHGHAAGDAILESVGARLNAVVRDSDYVIRYGGDEFIVVCPGLGDSGAAGRLGDRLRASIAEPIDCDGKRVSVTASVGMQMTTVRSGSKPTDFLRQADIALYAAKDLGRNATVIADQSIGEIPAT